MRASSSNGLIRSDQKELLRLMVERVVVNLEGKVRLELRAPFAYLHDIAKRMRLGERDQTNKNTSQDTSAGARSDAVPGMEYYRVDDNGLLLH